MEIAVYEHLCENLLPTVRAWYEQGLIPATDDLEPNTRASELASFLFSIRAKLQK